MNQGRSIWYQAGHFSPREVGWYECNMSEEDDDNWTSFLGVFCFWDGKRWIRPSGWPAEQRGTFTMVDGLLQVDKRGLFQIVKIREFRGLSNASRKKYDKSWDVPLDRIWDKKNNRLMYPVTPYPVAYKKCMELRK